MAVKTTLEQLEEVQAAITSVMSGQSYRIGDVSFSRANLSDLQKREECLLARYRRETDAVGVLTRPNFSGGATNDETS